MNDHDINTILDIGISLSSEKDLNRLLEKILSKVMELTHCDAGTLYLLDKDVLKFKIMRNDTMKTYEGGDGKDPKLPPVRLSRENVCSFSLLEGRTVCIADVRNCAEYDFSGPDPIRFHDGISDKIHAGRSDDEPGRRKAGSRTAYQCHGRK